MKRKMLVLVVISIIQVVFPDAIIIDHNCTDTSIIPANWIDSAKVQFKMYYGHTSHGAQILVGLDSVEARNPIFSSVYNSSTLPVKQNSICILEGKSIYAKDYWDTDSGINKTRKILKDNPTINISMHMWCDDLATNDTSYAKRYLDSMQILEKEFPAVKFVYTTGNMQNYPEHHSFKLRSKGVQSHLNNEIIRKFCKENNKILFDFGDIDCWYNGEVQTTTYNGITYPHEHSQYNIDQRGHTSLENCYNKGKAMWWLLVQLASWKPQITQTKNNKIKSNNIMPAQSKKKITYHINLQGRIIESGKFCTPQALINCQNNKITIGKYFK